MDILEEYFGIKTNQAAVSIDIQEMKIEMDLETNHYILGTRARRNKEATKLARLMQQASVVNIEGELSTILLRGKGEYMPAHSHSDRRVVGDRQYLCLIVCWA